MFQTNIMDDSKHIWNYCLRSKMLYEVHMGHFSLVVILYSPSMMNESVISISLVL